MELRSALPELHLARHPVMPDFVHGTASFSHTADSAMQVLDALGIAESRLTLRMAGPGRSGLEIVRQLPAPGTLLTPSVTITLWISGFGFFDALPMPMRESGGEAEFGTRELCRLFDDPLQKAGQWTRAGAPLFRIGPDKLTACRRWLSLFGIESSAWPEDLLYPLSLLAPTLASNAGRKIGIRLAFLILLGLPVHSFDSQSEFRMLSPDRCSRLGTQSSRIGCDLIAGDRQLDINSLIIQLGPVPLDVYTKFQSDSGCRLIDLAASVSVSAWQGHRVTWLVEDANAAPRLGIPVRNSRIGLNFHLGKGTRA
jgi:hypothetical protein